MRKDYQNWKVPKDKTPALVGWRFALFVGGFVSFIGAAMYFAYWEPKKNAQKYREIQKMTRKGEDLQARQPGGIMNVWRNPFKKD